MKKILLAACILIIGCLPLWSEGQRELKEEKTILKIGTPNEVKTASVFGDYYLGIFAHISNPPLMQMDGEGELTGLTAESVEVSDDNRVWTFYIRDDLYWSDGTQFTPEDVRFSIEYTGANNPNARWIHDTLKKAEIGPDNSVILTFNKPYTGLRLEFATYNIYPKHVYENIDDPMQYGNSGANVGFGPFYIEEIDLNAGVVRFARNSYWKGREPKIDGFEIHMYKNMDVLSLAIERGDVDTYYKYASSYPYANIDRLEKTGDFDFSQKLNMGLVFLAFNVRDGASADKQFREAVSYAIDYKEIVKLDALGYGRVPNRGFVPPSMGGYKDTPALEFNPSKAVRILESAGYKDTDGDGIRETPEGRDVSLSILVRSDWNRLGELLVDYLSDVGIESTLRSLDLNGWVAAKDGYDYDLTITRTTPWGMLMHANWGTGYFDSRRSGRGVLHVLDDPAFLDLCDRVLSTADEGKLLELGAEVQDYYAEHMPAAALYWNEIITPYNKAYSGWAPDPLYGIYNTETFLSISKEEEY
jgi:peptide/nickel transport system substrate-binding protein